MFLIKIAMGGGLLGSLPPPGAKPGGLLGSLPAPGAKPGGLLTYGIPNMKLDKETVERRITLMEEEGIEVPSEALAVHNVAETEERSLKPAAAHLAAHVAPQLAVGTTMRRPRSRSSRSARRPRRRARRAAQA